MKTALMCAAALPLVSGYVQTTWRDLQGNGAYSFDDYLQEFGKSYSGSEYAARKAVFERQLAKIRQHNADATQSWKMGLNKYSDWEESDMRRQLGLKGDRAPRMTAVHRRTGKAIPDAVDWRSKNVVTPVKNQGACGSCWAFSATEVLESAGAIATGKLQVLSPQQLVSCAPNPNHCGGTGGCDGSTQPLGFNYTKGHGLSLDSDYPYTARTGHCEKDKIKPALGIKGYTELKVNDYEDLLDAIANVGPIAVSVAASFGAYEEGVYDGNCGWTVDHAVVAVGYGHDAASGKDYWIVRNSWGESWGEKGYIRIRRYGKGAEPCGMDKKPQDGVACAGQDDPIRYCGQCAILSLSAYPTGAFNY